MFDGSDNEEVKRIIYERNMKNKRSHVQSAIERKLEIKVGILRFFKSAKLLKGIYGKSYHVRKLQIK